ncbi:MAG: hypothetical protein ABW166_07050 [Sedimenticola sp.]
MSQFMWNLPGETLSHKNACKEFDLEESEIIKAMRNGKLQYKENYAHGNPYFRLLRKEVITLAKEVHGEHILELKRIEYEIKKTATEINSHKRKISALEKKKKKLIQQRDGITN